MAGISSGCATKTIPPLIKKPFERLQSLFFIASIALHYVRNNERISKKFKDCLVA